ncbi:AsmA family protein [Marinigracilibium pacificum]|uniref:AsmA family protein n=1 Tax=Marinigracilibium pacificum TaxID=2729599 RepID=A0A848IXZ3_9BACT|nr:AsmA-like C-terminal region-containing protein [Marinigracilibium pacificum]NMM47114.1 AsmA family protein [Marinigracilibium pacificum]
MKKGLIIIGSIVVILLIAAITLPIIFKDDIKKAVDEALAENIDADVFYDAESLSISFFSHFPTLSVSIEEIGLVGRGDFEGIPLTEIQEFEVSLKPLSVIFGDQIEVSGIYIRQPQIYALILQDGKANYDIVKSSEEEVEEDIDTTSSDMKIQIDHWEISDGEIVYEDRSSNMFLKISGLNHEGNGNFGSTILDMDTETSIESITFKSDDVAYFSEKSFYADMVLSMDLDKMIFTFKENHFKVNDFGFNFNGAFEMPDENIKMDIKFGAEDNSFKSLLSLIPGIYTESFDDIETTGAFAFDGWAKGTYNENSLPGFGLDLDIKSSSFQYDDLPTPVENIKGTFKVLCPEGNIDYTSVEINNFHFNIEDNPFDLNLIVKNLVDYPIKLDANAKLDLEKITKVFPVEETTLKGIFTLAAKAEGKYDSVRNIIPAFNVDATLDNGYVKNAEYPVALENLHFEAHANSKDGSMNNGIFNLNDLSFILGKDKVQASAYVTNFDSPVWDANVNGTLNIEELSKVYPMEGVEMAGTVIANIKSKGRLKDVEAENYAALQTSGNVSLRNFNYSDEKSLPLGVSITMAEAQFTPADINIKTVDGKTGETDFKASGKITNYMGYALNDGLLSGVFNVSSNYFNVNEFMTEEAESEESEEESPLEVIKVPENLDIVLHSSANKVKYDNLVLSNLSGDLIIKNSAVKLENLVFNTLGGQFKTSGQYNTENIDHPKFDFALNIQNLSIPVSYQNFNTVQALAPIAEDMTGNFNTNFNLSGELLQDLTPKLSTITGKGLIEILDAAITDSKIIEGITSVTKLKDASGFNLKDALINVDISDGYVTTKPFNVNIAGYNAEVSGRTGIDGSVDYIFNIDVPAGAAGTAINNLAKSVTGGKDVVGEMITIPVKVGGKYDDLSFGLAGGKTSGDSESSVAGQATETIKKEAQAELDSQKKIVEDSAKAVVKTAKDSVTNVAEEKIEEGKEELKEKAEDALKNIFGKKKKKDDN